VKLSTCGGSQFLWSALDEWWDPQAILHGGMAAPDAAALATVDKVRRWGWWAWADGFHTPVQCRAFARSTW